MDSISDTIKNWWATPFQPNGDAISWALFLVFVVTVAFLWNRVLQHITEA
jgi:hypothetical protein